MSLFKEELSPDSQKKLREELAITIKANPMSLQTLTREMGINMTTLRKFFVKGLDLRDYVAVFKIINYINKQKESSEKK